MQIKIEIDVKPDELRRFLGLPDVAGIQDEVIQFLRTKVGQANESFNPGEFVKGNFENLRKTPAWKRFMARLDEAENSEDEGPAPKRPRTRDESTSKRPRKRAARKKT